MTIVSAKEILNEARANHYALGAFNTNNLEWTQAILRAAEEKQEAILMAVSMGAAKYMGGYKTVANLIRNLDESLNITVPVAIHLDHGNYQAAKEAIDAGFTSVMYDGSALDIEQNLKETKEIVEYAHARNVSVEAEVGSIGGEEDGIVADGEIASIDDALRMVDTGIDFLAAGIGNMHGNYPENWKGLNLKHLEKISQAVKEHIHEDMPLVLHGGSGVPDEQIRQAISLGVSKINVNTEAQLAFHDAVRAYVLSNEDLKGKNYDPRKFLKPGVEAIEEAIKNRIDVFANK